MLRINFVMKIRGRKETGYVIINSELFVDEQRRFGKICVITKSLLVKKVPYKG